MARRGAKPQELVIDLRDNPGGNTQAVRSVVERIFRGPLPLFESIAAKASGLVVKNQLVSFDEESRPSPDMFGHVFVSKFGREMFRFPGPIYEGKIWVLINERTASSAVHLASVAQQNREATLVGTEAGSNPASFGTGVILALESLRQVRLFVSTALYKSPRPGGEDPNRGLQPDVVLDFRDPTRDVMAREEILKFLHSRSPRRQK